MDKYSLTEVKSYEQAYEKHISKENTIFLKTNVALARNYQILDWYLKMFEEIEFSQPKPRTDPCTLNKIVKIARNNLMLKINDLTKV